MDAFRLQSESAYRKLLLNTLELETEKRDAEWGGLKPPYCLPRLLYIGQPAVSMTRGGSILLYRMLQKYPVERLRVVEANLGASKSNNRLPGVAYDTLNIAWARLLKTRFHGLYNTYLYAKAAVKSSNHKLDRIVREFRPESILTVFEGNVWLIAASLAERFQLPLHIISHDDWSLGSWFPLLLKPWLLRRFRKVYRSAATRFCVSPYMAQDFKMRFGVPGEVLYPLQPPDVSAPGPQLSKTGNKNKTVLTVAYAGSIYEGYERILFLLAESLEKLGGRLLIYSANSDALYQNGLVRNNIIIRAPVPPNQIIDKLRNEADVLCAAMSFRADHLPAMRAAFPSKLADYTATGLPIIVCGPPTCSLVRWAQENRGTAQIVCEERAEAMQAALRQIIEDDSYRASLAAESWKKGYEFFSHDVVTAQFYRAISK